MAPRDLRTSRRPRLTNPPPTRTHMGPAIVTIPTYAAPALPGEEDHPRKTQTASQPDATIAVPMRAETALNRVAIQPASMARANSPITNTVVIAGLSGLSARKKPCQVSNQDAYQRAGRKTTRTNPTNI